MKKDFYPNKFQKKVCSNGCGVIHDKYARCKSCGSDFTVVAVGLKKVKRNKYDKRHNTGKPPGHLNVKFFEDGSWYWNKKDKRKAPNLKHVKCKCITKAKDKVKARDAARKAIAKEKLSLGVKWGSTCGWPNKVCKSCGEGLPRGMFRKHKGMKDGRSGDCRKCRGLPVSSRKQYLIETLLEKSISEGKAYKYTRELATPEWLSDKHRSDIRDIYKHSKDCSLVTGESYEVNHITPLRGKTVCGLHVPWNLEVLPKDVNLKLGNTFEGGW